VTDEKDEGKPAAADIKVDDKKVDTSTNNAYSKEQVDKMIANAIDENLKPIKEKLDSAYAGRDEALAKVAEYEQKEREREIELLKEQGKHQEAHERELAEERAKREAAERRNVELTRDTELRAALGTYDFRNKNAQDMAFKELVSGLVRAEDGSWVDRSGNSIETAVKSFTEDEGNTFLFKIKANSGSGTDQPSKPSSPNAGKSLFDIPQAEVIKMAGEGKLSK
jgi:hypothetical protein